MRWPRLLLAPLLLGPLLAGSAALSTALPAPKDREPDKALLKIEERIKQLEEVLAELRKQGVGDPALADVEVYHRAAVWIVKHRELSHKDAPAWTLAVLDRGLLRGRQAARGESPWQRQVGHAVVRGHRSRIDGSVQPYAVTFPHDYASPKSKPYRLEVVLHVREPDPTEVRFLYRHRGQVAAPKDLDHIQLDVYGRGNNGYRWAGETDVFEAINHFLAVEEALGRVKFVDNARIVLRGFSMGGAGTWHLGLHWPDNWALLGPGAGFTTTRGYLPTLPASLPAHEAACLHIYDAADYAENVANVPVVAYSGADDPQIQAARAIEGRLKGTGLSITHLVAPGVKHSFPPEWRKKADAAYAKQLVRGRPEYPPRVRFVTYTLKYPSCFWAHLLGLERHYTQARVEAEKLENGFKVKTTNVRILRLNLWESAIREPIEVQIDGQKLDRVMPAVAGPRGELAVFLEKRGGRWVSALPQRIFTDRLRVLQKVNLLQGPIDDAFMNAFLCVRGTRLGWHEATQEHARANLERFEAEWSKYLRGPLPVKDDVDVTPDDLASRHLVLFGDPASNSLIEQVLPGLPLRWTKKQITFAGKDYDAARHVPVLIYPSPLDKDRYVVLNSGHTFRAADFQGSNARLYPRLGDHAILRLVPAKKGPPTTEVVTAGLFDDFWRLPARP
jgi:dienelactone hydrolase